MHKRRANIDLALKELERFGVVVEAVLDDLLDRAHIARLNVDCLLDLRECALAQAAISTAYSQTSLAITHVLRI